MTAALTEVDAALRLSGGPYFLGPSLSLVDILFVPFLERMAASLPYFKGFQSRSPAFPNLLRWYEAMDTRPTYAGIKSDYVSSLQVFYYYYSCLRTWWPTKNWKNVFFFILCIRVCVVHFCMHSLMHIIKKKKNMFEKKEYMFGSPCTQTTVIAIHCSYLRWCASTKK